MAKSSWATDIIIPAGLLLLAYKIAQNFGLIDSKTETEKAREKVSSVVSPECPRGKEYSRGYFETCDPNYLSQGNFFNDLCVCQSGLSPLSKPPQVSTNPFQDIINNIVGIISPESQPAAGADYTQIQQASAFVPADYQSGFVHPADIGAAVNQALGIPQITPQYVGTYGSSGDSEPAAPAISNEELAYEVAQSPTGQISPSSPYYSQYQAMGGGGAGAR